MDELLEVLFVLDGDAGLHEGELVELGLTVRSRLPPRVLVMAGTPAAVERAERIGVGRLVRPGAATAALALSDAEQLFVSAWATRGGPKVRRGDGASWDDPGFLPPDRPPRA